MSPPEQLLAAAACVPDIGELQQLYRWMRTARCIDETETRLAARGQAHFQVSGSGHEASAAFAPALQPGDYIHPHYRDKALLLARGIPIREFFDSLLCRPRSHSAGRQMSAHLSAPALNVLSMVGPVGNNALQAAGVAQELKDRAAHNFVLCSIGDGTTQQGEVLEAIAESVRSALPVLFLVHDNGLAISTRTNGQTFHSLPAGPPATYYGLPIHRVDGRDAVACHALFHDLVAMIRRQSAPVLCVMSAERLGSHTHADDDRTYRDPGELAGLRRNGDPVSRLRLTLERAGSDPRVLDELDAAIHAEVGAAARSSLAESDGRGSHSVAAPPAARRPARPEYRGTEGADALTMTAALRETLRERMASDPRVTLYGQDIEDPKGDVFGVTRGLSTRFPGRVRNAPLSESTIVGTSIGRALAGGRPVAFLQFADFIPLAFNQIACELGSMEWRTCGGWCAPVIVLAACGGYRPGLGPFHSHTFESILAHVPGVDVGMPSSAGEAAGMLNAAFESQRPTVILYPKALLNDRSRGTSVDVARHHVAVGTARTIRRGDAITIVAWGNTVPLCERAADRLADAGLRADLIDLRWISPWDRQTVIASAARTHRLVVVHEDNANAGFGAEVVASVCEALRGRVECKRVARDDVLLPCNPADQLAALPSLGSVLEAAADLLGVVVEWVSPAALPPDRLVVPVIGSSPSDLNVDVVAVPIQVGMSIREGQLIASVEADKAVVDIDSPASGIVVEIHVCEGQKALVGSPLLTLACAQNRAAGTPLAAEPIIVHRTVPVLPAIAEQFRPATVAVRIAGLASVRGSQRLTNSELAPRLPGLGPASDGEDGIFSRTGIESRLVAGPGQNVVSMATEAARQALREAGVRPEDLALVICSTSTPSMVSPSTASLVMHALAPAAEVPAYDLSAACSGYLYALANAWDFLQQRADAHVLVLTSEVMRSVVDINDPATSPLFGDAATATVLRGGGKQAGLATVQRPLLGGRGDDGSTLCVPLPYPGAKVRMDGKAVFSEAVRRMGSMLERACEHAKIPVASLSLVVPHQANGRILEALRKRLKLGDDQVWNEIRWQGNTSSSSIPMALDTVLRTDHCRGSIGLCAFGAGLTFGATLLQRD